MIFQSTIDTLTEDELSILFLISNNFLSSLGLEPNIKFVKMLRKDVISKIIDILKPQALEQNRYIFESLQKKLFE